MHTIKTGSSAQDQKVKGVWLVSTKQNCTFFVLIEPENVSAVSKGLKRGLVLQNILPHACKHESGDGAAQQLRGSYCFQSYCCQVSSSPQVSEWYRQTRVKSFGWDLKLTSCLLQLCTCKTTRSYGVGVDNNIQHKTPLSWQNSAEGPLRSLIRLKSKIN